MKTDKVQELENIYKYHTYNKEGGFTYGWEKLYDKYKKHRFLALKPFFTGKSVLEIGPAEGDMTAKLLECFDDISVIEGSEGFAKNLRNTFKTDKLTIYSGLVEDTHINRKFDTVILSHILEHFDSPSILLKKVKTFLDEKGILLVIVPNANSLHRHMGVILKLLDELHSLNEVDIKIGHKRVYDFISLEKEVTNAGFSIIERGGILIKILSNLQMVEHFSEEILEAFFKLGNVFPEIACEIFVVCTISH